MDMMLNKSLENMVSPGEIYWGGEKMDVKEKRVEVDLPIIKCSAYFMTK